MWRKVMNRDGSREPEARLQALLERCRNGDDAAWNDLVNHFDDQVRGTARRLGTRDEELADISQGCWMIVLCLLRRTSGFTEAQFDAWLRRIAERVVAQHRRAASRWARWASAQTDGHAENGTEPPETSDVGSSAERIEATASLHALLDRMPPKRGMVVFLHEVGDLTCGEIAERLGGKESTVRATLRDGFRQLRAEVGDGSGPGVDCRRPTMRTLRK